MKHMALDYLTLLTMFPQSHLLEYPINGTRNRIYEDTMRCIQLPGSDWSVDRLNAEIWTLKTISEAFLLSWQQMVTCVTVSVKITYAATESDVIHAKGAPKLYASIPATKDIWKYTY